MTQRIGNPFPIFLDRQGLPLDGGNIYIGTAGADPETSPVDCFWDAALTLPATQPIRTLGGQVVNGSTPAFIYIEETNYSIRARDSDGHESFYTANAVVVGAGVVTEYQPLDSDLTSIAALTTTAYGRSLLTVADAAALRTTAAIPASLSTSGGTVTGNIVRQGSGTHLYHADAALTSGRIFLTASGAADPTSLPGDVWLKKTS